MQKGLCLLFLLLTLNACGNDKNVTIYEEESEERVLQSISNNEIKNPLAASVAALINEASKYAKLGLLEGCTSFLIENNIMVTNAHCVPGKAAGESCAEIGFKFFRTGIFNEEAVSCEKVLFVSVPKTYVFTNDTFEVTKDYAYLKIKRSPARPPLKVSYEGVDDLEPVGVISVSFAANKLVENACYVKHGTNIYPAIKQKVGPVFQMNNCPVVKGNSGSPVINSKGLVVGVLSDQVWAEESSVGAKVKKKSAGLATNFSCTNPSIAATKECEVQTATERKKTRSNETLLKTRKAFDEAEQQELDLIEKNSQLVVWGYSAKRGSDSYFYNASPLCVDTSAAPSQRSAQRLTSFQIHPYTDTEHVSVVETKLLVDDVEFNVTKRDDGKFRVISRGSGGNKEHMLPACNKLQLFQACRLTPEKCPLIKKVRLID